MAGRRAKSLIMEPKSVEHANTLLQSLPAKPKSDLSLKTAVAQLRESLQAALAKGYSYEDLATILTDKGIKISASTLKNYMPAGKGQVTKAKTRRAKKMQLPEGQA